MNAPPASQVAQIVPRGRPAMKILHVVSSLEGERGGPPTVACQLAVAQHRLGHAVAILAPGAPEVLEATPGGQEVAHHRPPGRAPGGLMWPARLRGLRDLVARHDFVHVHEVWPPLALVAARAARAERVPYAVAPHGCLDPWSVAQKRLKKRFALVALGYRAMLDRAAFLHALTPEEAMHLERWGLKVPVEVLPNGMAREQLEAAPAPGCFRELHPELAGRPYVLFLGRLHAGKGLDVLAEAFARFAEQDAATVLVVVGPDRGARRAFEARVAALAIADRVFLMGPRYGREKLAALVDASCFVLPSEHEGFSMAIVEALALGVPVIASPQCGFPEVASRGAGRIVPRSPDAVAGALRELMGDPALRRSMGEQGRELVLERYLWSALAERSLVLAATSVAAIKERR